MTRELAERITNIVQNQTTKAVAAADDLAQVGGILAAGARWDRDAEVRRSLEGVATALQALARSVTHAAELIDLPENGRAA